MVSVRRIMSCMMTRSCSGVQPQQERIGDRLIVSREPFCSRIALEAKLLDNRQTEFLDLVLRLPIDVHAMATCTNKYSKKPTLIYNTQPLPYTPKPFITS